MASTVNLFNTGKSALFANKAALATTGHNIANVNTEGYSRQRVELSASDPIKLGSSVFGSGVRLDSVGRVTDDYLNKQINQEQKILGFSEESDVHLKHLESIFNEVNGVGMNNLISKFFNEFRKLANEPNDDALRASVRESAIQVVGDFKRINLQLDGIRHNIDARIDGYVREINGYCDQVAQLNDQVKRLELTGGSANDIKDKRDLVLKKLSDVLDVNVAEGDRGAVQVTLAGVGTLVSGNKSNHIKAEPTPPAYDRGKEAGSLDLTLDGATYPEITTKMKSSKVGALTTLRDGQIYNLREKMDEMAYVLLKSVNMVHSIGYGKDGVNLSLIHI